MLMKDLSLIGILVTMPLLGWYYIFFLYAYKNPGSVSSISILWTGVFPGICTQVLMELYQVMFLISHLYQEQ